MKIDTERLEIVLLNSKQLEMWCENITALESVLDCRYEGEPMEGVFLDIVKNQIKICEGDSANCTWHSFWLIINKADRIAVGSSGFKNIPNNFGEVEIGYGLGNGHEHKGYMAECVSAMSSWALQQEGVRSVIAETEPGNLPSEKVLIRCGFEEYETLCDNKWWKLHL